MEPKLKQTIDILCNSGSLSRTDYQYLIDNYKAILKENYLAKKAISKKEKFYNNDIYIRGLIEISNICKNDCYYCGIRKSNKACQRYRMSIDNILDCCKQGYDVGIRTFVLQGGEDNYYNDEFLATVITNINNKYPDCVITLSLGEKTENSYKFLYDCGARRYLLRHETADKEHYRKLHPNTMSFNNRIACLNSLKKIGYQTGCGFMVGSPFQTSYELSKDLKFIENFRPEMVGIGPFIAQKNTPFFSKKNGNVALTLFLISLIRLIVPYALIPATTALETLDPHGLKHGLSAGANVIMINLAPKALKEKYIIYDNKYGISESLQQVYGNIEKIACELNMNICVSQGNCKYVS